MKLLLLSAASSIHTVRWVNALCDGGVEVVLVTQHALIEPVSPAVRVYRLPFSTSLGYFLNVPSLRNILEAEKPDLVNAHYASGYGTTARLAAFKPTLMSVWGSDVYDFPDRSTLHRWWLRSNLMSANAVASTSHAMAAQTRLIAPALGEIAVTPFGVETDRFSPSPDVSTSVEGPITIGTVKHLSEKYGIDTLIQSIDILVRQLRVENPEIAGRLEVRIVGDGPQKKELQKQADDLGIGGIVRFIGRIPHDDVPGELRKLDIYVALSRLDSESFGVAIVEAGACGLPVVVSDVGGLSEVVADGETGIIVPRESPEAAAEALRVLVLDPALRQRMGQASRRRIISLYEWHSNVRQMINLYERLLKTSASGRRGQESA